MLRQTRPEAVLQVVLVGVAGHLLAGPVWGLEQAATGSRDGFTIVLLPDTQKYTRKYPQIFLAQTEWIKKRTEADRFKFVIHLGDITDKNSDPEWKIANEAMGTLDGIVAYSVLPGNHDGGKRVNNTQK